jgi:hypothetical protein
VGLVQREIEAAGIATIILTPIPDLAVSVSAPRIAAIEYPLGRTLGQPGDAVGQKAVLCATLDALETIHTPGGVAQLPFEWTADDGRSEPPETPPIVKLVQRNPWLLPRLLRRSVPD